MGSSFSQSTGRQELITVVAIFIVTFLIFWFSPIRQLTDSNYSMLLSESLIHHRTFVLDGYTIPRLKPTWHDNTFKNGEMYQLELVGHHLYYYLPPGSSILSVPYVAWMNAFGVSAANADGSYNPEGETRIEAGLASLLMAALACVLFFTARLLLPVTWSAVIALGAVFGTQVWSTASRALWSDTWAIFLLGASLYILLADATRKRQLNPILLATLLAWTYFVRPTNAISIGAIAVYVFVERREQFLTFIVTGFCWLAIFMAYSWYHFHQLLPNYFLPGRLNFGSFGTAFAGNLVSPSRGLLVYLPVLLFVAYLAIRYRRVVFKSGLARIAVPVIVLHLITISGFTPWNGGFCYGPRYTTGLVPWFALLGILGIQGLLLTVGQERRSRGPLFAGAILVGISIFVNARGATSYETWMWNVWPDSVDKVPEKIWDWRRPQFLAGLVAPPLSNPLPVLRERVQFGAAEADRFTWYGWSWGEKDFRWSDGKEAAIAFAVEESRDSILLVRLGAFVFKDKLGEQHVSILLNGSRLEELTLNAEPAKEYCFPVDRNLLQARNTLVFKLPDAASPKSLGLSPDQRRLAIRIESIELRPAK
jgi:hypothetical protein